MARPRPDTTIPHRPGETEAAEFRSMVYRKASEVYRQLPWRETTDPYLIMVSEVMLQQTQVERVRNHYLRFAEQFPTVASLAGAQLSHVLAVWQGLGYNRRALNLKRAAEEIVERHGGIVPLSAAHLVALPGIGRYTAGAIAAFAYNQPAVFMETNIRSVYLHVFFADRQGVHDRELLPLVEATLDRHTPRRWYNALMDYGASLKRNLPNPSRRSLHHASQSPFAGSNRQQRSSLLRTLLANPGLTLEELAAAVAGEPGRVLENLGAMEREGLLLSDGGRWQVPGGLDSDINRR